MLRVLATSHQSRPNSDRVDPAPASAARSRRCHGVRAERAALRDGRPGLRHAAGAGDVQRKMGLRGPSKPTCSPRAGTRPAMYVTASCGSLVVVLGSLSSAIRSTSMIPKAILGRRAHRSHDTCGHWRQWAQSALWRTMGSSTSSTSAPVPSPTRTGRGSKPAGARLSHGGLSRLGFSAARVA